MIPTAASCDAPVNTSNDITDACATLRPDATARTPNAAPNTPTATPSTMPSRTYVGRDGIRRTVATRRAPRWQQIRRYNDGIAAISSGLRVASADQVRLEGLVEVLPDGEVHRAVHDDGGRRVAGDERRAGRAGR